MKFPNGCSEHPHGTELSVKALSWSSCYARGTLPSQQVPSVVGYLHPGSVNTTLFKNRVFAYVVKLRWGHVGLRWTLIQLWVSFQEEGNLDTETDAQGECQVTTEAEVGVLHLQAEEAAGCQQGNKEGPSPRAFWESMVLSTPRFQTSSSRTVRA